MAFGPGYKAYIAIDNASGSITNLSPYADDTSVPQSQAMLDVSVFGTVAKAFVAGLAGGDQITWKGPYDPTLHSHLGSLLAAQQAGTVSHSFIFGPGGSVSGQAKISGEFLVAQYTPSGSVAGRAEWTSSLQITGAVTNGVF